jgi:tetratricopeptide (TPR) repeat protein
METGRFEVVDRQNLTSVLAEQIRGSSGIVDDSTAAEAGKILGVQALIFGRVKNFAPKEQIKEDKWKDKKGYHITYTRIGRCDVAANFKVIDATTGKILSSKDFAYYFDDSTSAVDQDPPSIDINLLCSQSANSVVKSFLKVIAPYKISVPVYFESIKKSVATERGIKLAKADQLENALESFLEAASQEYKDAKDRASAFYNLGVTYKFLGKYDKAFEFVNQAVKINPVEKYANELTDIKKMQADQKKLEEQMNK